MDSPSPLLSNPHANSFTVLDNAYAMLHCNLQLGLTVSWVSNLNPGLETRGLNLGGVPALSAGSQHACLREGTQMGMCTCSGAARCMRCASASVVRHPQSTGRGLCTLQVLHRHCCGLHRCKAHAPSPELERCQPGGGDVAAVATEIRKTLLQGNGSRLYAPKGMQRASIRSPLRRLSFSAASFLPRGRLRPAGRQVQGSRTRTVCSTCTRKQGLLYLSLPELGPAASALPAGSPSVPACPLRARPAACPPRHRQQHVLTS